jgi:hypothetical protein
MKSEAGERRGPTLQTVRRRLERWRARRWRHEAIPEELWAAAVQLTEEHSLLEISKALGLNYTNLKERAGRRASGESRAENESGFVEVCLPGCAPASREYSLELENGRGEKLRLSVKGEAEAGVLRVLEAFWERTA